MVSELVAAFVVGVLEVDVTVGVEVLLNTEISDGVETLLGELAAVAGMRCKAF